MRPAAARRFQGLRTVFQQQPAPEFEEPAAVPVDEQEDIRGRIRTLPAAVTPTFILIFLLGAFVRLVDLTWDQNTHIHPDERFLTMLGTGVRIPSSVLQYFDPTTSPLSPYNIPADVGMVYGMVPVTINKILAVWLGNDNYGMFTIQGRGLSALADLGTLLFVYLIARRFAERGLVPVSVALLAPALYAISVFPIQNAHFFTVDSFLNFFAWGSVYFAVRYSFGGSSVSLVVSGLLLGFSIASKVSGVYIAPVVVYFIICRPVAQTADPFAVLAWLRRAGRDWRTSEKALEDGLFAVVVLAATVYVGLRLGNPYYFQSANPFDPRLGQQFLSNLHSLSGYDTPNPGYPPGIQWIHKPPVTFALVNLAVFGVGVPYFLAAVAGSYIAITRLVRTPIVVLLFWTVAFFLYQSVQYVKTMRYFILLYPALAIFAAIGLAGLLLVVRGYFRPILALALIMWPLAFMSIYTKDHSRVTASEWMYRNLPNNSVVLCESAWEDCLPLGVANTEGKAFVLQTLDFFYTDSPSKWQKDRKLLARGNYLVLSSNRGWGSTPTDPQDFPQQTEFYKRLFAGKTAYREIARFTSYPSLRYLGIPIDFPDQWAEEAFTVYDHPEVIIFEHVR